MKRLGATAILCVCAALAAACDPQPPPAEPEALAFVLAPRPALDGLDREGSDAPELHGGDALDREIGRLQRRVAGAGDVVPHLDRLGWAFVAKARRDSDPGYYFLAERCAAAMVEAGADGPEAWLLRGHALHGLHRFEEAERLARALVAARASPSITACWATCSSTAAISLRRSTPTSAWPICAPTRMPW